MPNKRTAAQKKRMSDAQKKRYADARSNGENGGDDITKTVEDVLSAINLAREIRQLVPPTSAIKIVSSLEENDA